MLHHLHKVSACLSALFTVSLAHSRFRGRVMDIKLPKGLSDMTATANPSDGLIYIAGGCDSENGNEYNIATTYFDCSSITDTFFSFNPNTNEFKTLPSMPRERNRHAAAISQNRLWLIGGRNQATDIVYEIDVYDFTLKKWFTPGNHTEGTSDFGAFADEFHVYVGGGYDADYIARNSLWRINASSIDSIQATEMASLQEARGDIKMVVNRRQQAFVAGGFTDVNNFCPALSTAEMYNIKTNTWSYVDDLSIPRGDMSLLLLDHHLIALGGETQIDETCPETIDPGESTVVMDDVEILDHNGHWEVVASIPDPLFRAEAVSVDNRIFIFGGQNAYNKTCRCYDTSDDIVILLEEEGGMAHADSPTSSPSVAFEVVSSSFLSVTLVLFAAFGAFI